MAWTIVNPDRRRVGLPIVVVLALLITLLCDLPTYVGFGGVSGSAALSAGLAILALVTIPQVFHPSSAARGAVLVPWLLFSLWSLVLVLAEGAGKEGIQEMVLFLIPPSLGILTANFVSAGRVEAVYKGLSVSGWILGTLYLIGVVIDGLGADATVGRRSFALEMLVISAAFLACPSSSPWHQRWLPTFALVTIALSLSRTAMVFSALMLAVNYSFDRARLRVGRASLLLTLGAVLLTAAVLNLPTLHERFFGGDQAFEVGGLALSTQGRSEIWSVLLDDGSMSLFGNGLGSARAAILDAVPGQTEPHNDFLRVYYDMGLLGLVLLVGSLGVVAFAFLRAVRAEPDPLRRVRYVGAIAALFALIAGSSTDNALVYSFVAAPLGLILGLPLVAPGDGRPGCIVPFRPQALERVPMRKTSATVHLAEKQ